MGDNVDLNLAILDLEEMAERERRLQEARRNCTLPLIHESLVDFLLDNTPKLPN